MHEPDDRDEQAAATPIEGVRILGAEEARAVAGERGATWSASGEQAGGTDTPGAEPPSGEVPALQHWTEPPSGAVPAIFTDDTGEQAVVDDDLDAWAAVSGGHRFRGDEGDWSDVDVAAELGAERGQADAAALVGDLGHDAEGPEGGNGGERLRQCRNLQAGEVADLAPLDRGVEGEALELRRIARRDKRPAQPQFRRRAFPICCYLCGQNSQLTRFGFYARTNQEQ